MKIIAVLFVSSVMVLIISACGSITADDTLLTNIKAIAAQVGLEINADTIKTELKALAKSGLIKERDTFRAKLDSYVAAGTITQAQADKILALYDEAIAELSAEAAAAKAHAAAVSKTATRK